MAAGCNVRTSSDARMSFSMLAPGGSPKSGRLGHECVEASSLPGPMESKLSHKGTPFKAEGLDCLSGCYNSTKQGQGLPVSYP